MVRAYGDISLTHAGMYYGTVFSALHRHLYQLGPFGFHAVQLLFTHKILGCAAVFALVTTGPEAGSDPPAV